MKTCLGVFLLCVGWVLAGDARAESLSSLRWGSKNYNPGVATSYLNRVENKNDQYFQKTRKIQNSYGVSVRRNLNSYTRQQESLASNHKSSLRNAANGSGHLERQLRNAEQSANAAARSELLNQFNK